MKKIFAALMIAAAIAAFVLPKAQTYAAESADDYVAVKNGKRLRKFHFFGIFGYSDRKSTRLNSSHAR